MDLEAKINNRIAELHDAAQEVERKANIELTAIATAIAELRKLIEPQTADSTPSEASDTAQPG